MRRGVQARTARLEQRASPSVALVIEVMDMSSSAHHPMQSRVVKRVTVPLHEDFDYFQAIAPLCATEEA
jgi:hypothetical protein